jgi:hypothetical protein
MSVRTSVAEGRRNAGSGTEGRGRKGFAEGAKEIHKDFLCLLSRPLRFFASFASGQVRIQEVAP